MGNKFLALRKSEVAEVAPGRACIPSIPVDWGIGEQGKEVKVSMEFDRGT